MNILDLEGQNSLNLETNYLIGDIFANESSNNILNNGSSKKKEVLFYDRSICSPLLSYEEYDNIFLNEFQNQHLGSDNEPDIIDTNKSFQSLYFLQKDKGIPSEKEFFNTNNSTKYPNTQTNATITFKTFLYKKRGRKKEKNSCKNFHSSGDFDNIQTKIQVSFINFLINLANDAINTVIGKQCKLYFKDIMYKYKKKVSYDYLEELKKSKYSDILTLEMSRKKRKLNDYSNKQTYLEICKMSPELKKFLEKNYLYLFQKYFCKVNEEQDILEIDNLKIKLSPNTKGLSYLLRKNFERKEKFLEIIQNVYFNGNEDLNKNKIISSSQFITIAVP